jgi:hypothetical protein
VIPISLGPVPSGISGACAIDPFETDNLLDATQRHFSMDWNTVVAGPETVSTTSLGPHAVDTPSHPPLSADGQSGDGENMAGDVLIRNYLAPPGQQNQVQAPYVIVRDVNTGCPYPVSWLTTGGNNWVYAPAPQQAQPNCSTSNGNTPGAGCGAIFSTVDLSCPPTHPGCGVPNWLDTNQQSLHSNFTQITPQGCYTNGNTVNDLAWVRSPEWVGRPGPDDSYLSAAVSATDLTYAANHVKALMLQFQLPDMPAIPCAVGQGCSLSGNEQLRYLSLSFVQQQSSSWRRATSHGPRRNSTAHHQLGLDNRQRCRQRILLQLRLYDTRILPSRLTLLRKLGCGHRPVCGRRQWRRAYLRYHRRLRARAQLERNVRRAERGWLHRS